MIDTTMKSEGLWQGRIVNFIWLVQTAYGASYMIREDNVVSNWVNTNAFMRAWFVGFIIILSGLLIKWIYHNNHRHWDRMVFFLLPPVLAALMVVVQVAQPTNGVWKFAPPQHAVAHTVLVAALWIAWATGSHMDDIIEQNNEFRDENEMLRAERDALLEPTIKNGADDTKV